MAQTSLLPKRPHFSDPDNAKAAGSLARKRGGVGEQFRDLRLQQVIEMKTRNMPNEDIARHFNCSVATIVRDVAKIKRDGLVEKYEARILRRLMPLAFRKIERALRADDGDLEAAKLVMVRFDKLSQQKHERELSEAANGGGESSLADWYASWSAANTSPPAEPSEAIDAIDVEAATGGVEFVSQ